MKNLSQRAVENAQAAGKSAAKDLDNIKDLRRLLPIREEDRRKIKAKLDDVRSKHAPMAAAVEQHGGKIRRDSTGHAVTEDLEQLAEMLEEQAQNMSSAYFSFELENVAAQLTTLAKCYREFAVVATSLRDLELQHSRQIEFIKDTKSEIDATQQRIDNRRANAPTAPVAGGGSLASALKAAGVR